MVHISESFYREIAAVFPIPCVDLRVVDLAGRVLLVKRVNDPAKGEWWFPGGRVHFLETREQAAIRKLREECGLVPASIREVGTYDVILDLSQGAGKSHGITTLFAMVIDNPDCLKLDSQSESALWLPPDDWQQRRLHPFIHHLLHA